MGKRQKRKRREGHPPVSSQKAGLRRQVLASRVAVPAMALSEGGMVQDAIVDSVHSGSGVAEGGDGIGCRHVQSGIDLEKLREQFREGAVAHCDGCGNGRSPSGKDRKGKRKFVARKSVWICLACGHTGCGGIKEITQNPGNKDGNPKIDSRVAKQNGDSHAKAHWKQTQHPVVMQWGQNFICWCFVCNLQLKHWDVSSLLDGAGVDVVDGKPNTASKPELLLRAATLLQENCIRDTSSLKVDHAETVQATEVKEEITPTSSYTVPAVNPSKSRRVVKGLMNLGNTCFFNSVMQNLVGVSMLRDHFSVEASGQEGTLTTSFRKFYQEMDPVPVEKGDGADINSAHQDGSMSGPKRTTRSRSFGSSIGAAVTPRGLFSAISVKAPRFKGFQQQDSHELLRCLLDGLHTEEESMRQSGVGSGGVREVESAAKSDASRRDKEGLTAEEEASEGEVNKVRETFVEQMFGGQLSSTVSCCECGHSSVVYEPFLDLSVPMPSKQSIRKMDSCIEQLSITVSQRNQRGHAFGSGAKGLKAPESLKTVNGVVDTYPAAGPDLFTQGVTPGLSIGQGFAEVSSVVSDDSGNKPGSVIGGRELDSTTADKDHVALPVLAPAVICLPHGAADSGDSASGHDLDTWMDYVGDGLTEETPEELTEMNLGSMLNDIGDWSAVSDSEPTASSAQGVDTGVEERSPGKSLHGGEQRRSNFQEGVSSSYVKPACSVEEGCASNEPLNSWKLMEEVIHGLGPCLPNGADQARDDKELHLNLPGSLVPGNALPTAEEGLAVASCHNEKSAEDKTDIEQSLGSTSNSKLATTDREEMVAAPSVSEKDDGDFDGVAGLFDDEVITIETKGAALARKHEMRSLVNMDGLDSASGGRSSRAEVDAFHFAGNGGRSGLMKEIEEGDSYSSLSLEGCLLAFTRTEILSGENAWGCENCTRKLQEQLQSYQMVLHDGDQKSDLQIPPSGTRRQSTGKRPTVTSDKPLVATKDVVSIKNNAPQGPLEPLALEVSENCVDDLSSLMNSNSLEDVLCGMNLPVGKLDQPQLMDRITRISAEEEVCELFDSCATDKEKVAKAEGLVRAGVRESEPNAGQESLPLSSGWQSVENRFTPDSSMLFNEFDSVPTSMLEPPASLHNFDDSEGLEMSQAEEFQALSSHGPSNLAEDSFLIVDDPSITSDGPEEFTLADSGKAGLSDGGRSVRPQIVELSSIDVNVRDTDVDFPANVGVPATNASTSNEQDNGGEKLKVAGAEIAVHSPTACTVDLSSNHVMYGPMTQSQSKVTVPSILSDVDQWTELPMPSRQSRLAPAKSAPVCNGRPSKHLEPYTVRPAIKEAPKVATVKREATKRFLISKAPPVLTVHLKRFAQDMHGRLSKLSGHVTFHERLDLGPFMDQRNGNQRDCIYRLIGTVEHSGTMRGGHYVAYVKGPAIDGEDEPDTSSKGASTWYYISDSHVRKTSLESVLQSEAYLLFYERETSE